MKPIRRHKSAKARRADILAAAESLFIEQGIHATRMEDIAVAAGIGKGTIYLYFYGKEDLLIGLQEVFIDYFLTRIDAHLQKCTSPSDDKEQFQAWLRGCIDAFYDKAELHDLVFHTSGQQAIHHRHDNPAVAKLECILQAGTFSCADVPFTAAVVFNAVHGAMEYAFTQTPLPSKEILFDKINQLLMLLLVR